MITSQPSSVFDNQSIKLFTLGYEGINLETYIKILIRAGCGSVIDIREKPWSHKKGFSKNGLSAALKDAGIQYLHLQSAGNPSAIRKNASSIEECLSLYKQHLKNNSQCLNEMLPLIIKAANAGQPACLTCFEQQPSKCHRSVIIDELVRRASFLEICHLYNPFIQSKKLINGLLSEQKTLF